MRSVFLTNAEAVSHRRLTNAHPTPEREGRTLPNLTGRHRKLLKLSSVSGRATGPVKVSGGYLFVAAASWRSRKWSRTSAFANETHIKTMMNANGKAPMIIAF